MGLLTKLKSSYLFTHFEVGKYTKRRRSMSCEFEPQDKDFYGKNYQNGEYLHCISEKGEHRDSVSKKRWSMVGGSVRSSEAYNDKW
jgi:hypothetical protein